MTGRSPGPWGGKVPAASDVPGIPDDADGYEDISVLSLAGLGKGQFSGRGCGRSSPASLSMA